MRGRVYCLCQYLDRSIVMLNLGLNNPSTTQKKVVNITSKFNWRKMFIIAVWIIDGYSMFHNCLQS